MAAAQIFVPRQGGIKALLERLDSSLRPSLGLVALPKDALRSLVLSWPGLDEVLPDGGLPRGVVELSAPRALGGSTSLALAAVQAGQARGSETKAWCAWIDPERTLHAPGVVAAGVDLERLLVVAPPRAELARTAVKVVGSGAFEVVVVDFDAVPGALAGRLGRSNKAWAPEVLVRKLALAAEPNGVTVLLLSDATRSANWPVSLRLELTRPTRSALSVRVTKDKRGRTGLSRTIPFRPAMRLAV